MSEHVITAEERATLRELLEQASPAPWHLCVTPDKQGAIDSPRLAMNAYTRASLDLGEGDRAYYAGIEVDGRPLEETAKIVALTGNGPRSEAHARLIIGMYHLAPRLLDALEACEGELVANDRASVEAVRVLAASHAERVAQLEDERDAARSALLAAAAALEAHLLLCPRPGASERRPALLALGVFMGAGAERAAWAALEHARVAWSCHLFRRVANAADGPAEAGARAPVPGCPHRTRMGRCPLDFGHDGPHAEAGASGPAPERHEPHAVRDVGDCASWCKACAAHKASGLALDATCPRCPEPVPASERASGERCERCGHPRAAHKVCAGLYSSHLESGDGDDECECDAFTTQPEEGVCTDQHCEILRASGASSSPSAPSPESSSGRSADGSSRTLSSTGVDAAPPPAGEGKRCACGAHLLRGEDVVISGSPMVAHGTASCSRQGFGGVRIDVQTPAGEGTREQEVCVSVEAYEALREKLAAAERDRDAARAASSDERRWKLSAEAKVKSLEDERFNAETAVAAERAETWEAAIAELRSGGWHGAADALAALDAPGGERRGE